MKSNIEFREGLDELAGHYRHVLQLLGENPDREGLEKTPMRVAKAMQVLTRGYTQDPQKVLTDALFAEEYNQMVIVKDIDFFSMCEHHMLPFYGKAHVAYIPNGYITGLSKVARVVDRSLVGTHAFDVFIQRDHFLLTGRIEQEQIGELALRHAVRGVDSQLDAAAEIGEERLVGFAIRIAHAGELGFDLLLHALGDGMELAIVLQRFARDVERQVVACHDAAHEAEIIGQKLFALVHDQDIRTIERKAFLEIARIEVVGRAARNEQQRIVGQRAFRMQGNRAQRIGEVVEVRLVEFGVFLVGHVGALALPDRHHGIHGLELRVLLVFRLVVVAGIFGLGVNTMLLVSSMAACFFVAPTPQYLWMGVTLISAASVFSEFAYVNYNAVLPRIAHPAPEILPIFSG